MTVPSDINKSGPYYGNGSTTAFDYDFRILNETHIKVVIRNDNGVLRPVELGSDYTVTGVGDAAGGQILMTSPPANGETITLLLDVPFKQEVDLENQGAYYAETVEAALDLAVMRDQQMQEQLARAIKLPEGSDLTDLEPLAMDLQRVAQSADAIDDVAANIAAVDTVADNIDDVAALGTVGADLADLVAIKAQITTVAGIKNDVTSVAAVASDVSDVASIKTDVSSVSAGMSNVSTVAGKSADISTVAAVAADVSAVANIVDEVAAVAGATAAIEDVVSISADISAVAAKAADVSTVAGMAAAVADVAAVEADVSAVAGISAEISAVAAVAADVATVAGVADGLDDVAAISGDIAAVVAASSDIQAVAAVAGSLSDVIDIADEIAEVAAIKSDVSAVGAIAADVSTVAAAATDISAVAGAAADISDIKAIAGDIAAVAAIDGDVSIVASNISDVTAVVAGISDIQDVAPLAADISTVAAVAAGISALAPVADDIQIVAGIKDDILAVPDFAADAKDARDEAVGAVSGLVGGSAGQVLAKNSSADHDYTWKTVDGAGDMPASTYDPNGVASDAFDMDNMVEGSTNLIFTQTERDKLDGIEDGAQVNPGNATTSAAGLMSASDKSKLDGIASGATANTGTVTSVGMSVPTGFSVSGGPITTSGTLAVTYAAGYQGYTTAEASKLAGIATGATANTGTVTSVAVSVPTGFSVSGSPITTSGTVAITYASGYEGFTTTLKNKLNGIEASADVTDAANVGASIHGSSAKTTPVDADTVALIDSAASNVLKKLSWSNIKATLKAYFDTIYATASDAVSKSGTSQTLTGSYQHTPYNYGNLSSGITLDPANGLTGTIIRNGAGTIAAPTGTPSGVYTMVLFVDGTSSSGSVTMSGFSNTDFGDDPPGNNQHAWLYVTVGPSAKTAKFEAIDY